MVRNLYLENIHYISIQGLSLKFKSNAPSRNLVFNTWFYVNKIGPDIFIGMSSDWT